ncbi:fibronectin type III domain-containing protein [Paenibacillus odorifer]|uniref:fibronectin type III domain-containing protein n=1 Tax=Paenibacillus odorifer TaxID=189426 RepID=UPI00096D7A46|nr:fibronectin type III domain-containing protein [Paenibacillus odorifer]OMD76580.1 hypothetical protein BSK50_14890 [Paenibacillus odorifer]
MKRSIYVIGTLFFVLIAFNPMKVSAAPDGLMNGKPLTYGLNIGDTVKSTLLLTDNDITTGDDIWYRSGYQLWHKFDPAVNIDGYLYKGTQNVVFTYQIKGEKVSRTYDGGSGYLKSTNTKEPISVLKNVEYVSIISADGNYKTGYEFDVFGSEVTNTDSSLFVINNLEKTVDSISSITLKWLPINSVFLKQYKVYQDDVLIGTVNQNNISVSGLVAGESYTFKVVPVDSFNKEFTGGILKYAVPLPDLTPPAIPKDIKVVPDRYTANVSWAIPLDDDLLGYYIYLDDLRVNDQPILTNYYTLSGLKIDSEYHVSVSSVDLSGNVSVQSKSLSFRTLTLQTVPSAPGNLRANAFYKGANLSWLPSSSAQEYIVYMNGNQLFKTVQTSAKVTSLENGKDYTFAVSAVNEIGESDLTDSVTVTPLDASPVDVTLGYSLKDISDGTANMFSAQWLLLAFAIAIPLSFYISNRVKGLFIS